MAKVEIRVDLSGMKKDIRDLDNIDMKRIGIRAIDLNFQQIARKKNSDGSSFLPYTTEYAERKGVGTGAVDLTSKGAVRSDPPHMLFTYKVINVTKRRALTGFRILKQRLKAKGIVSGGKNNLKPRPFIGLDKNNRKKLVRFVSDILLQG